MAVKLSPLFNDAQLDGNGNPWSGARLFTYAAGSSTKLTTYQDSAGGVPHSNPIELNARGEPPAPIWLTEGSTYKFILTSSTDSDPPASPTRTIDNVSGINDTTSAQDEWTSSGHTPTYISATSFSVSGDQTTAYAKRRRLKSSNTGGTVYSTVVSSSFASNLTTVTVANDSGSLDSGLSSVSIGIVRPANPSIDPDMVARKGSAVASAATCDIWSIVGDFVHITGTTTITSFGTAPYAGARRDVIIDSTPIITHNSTTLQCPGGRNILCAAGDRLTVRADTTANVIITNYERAGGTPVVGTSVPRSYLAGLGMSTAGSSTTMTIAAGQAADSTNSMMMTLAASIGKTTGAWAVGSGNGGLDTGTIANSTWYKFFAIMRPDTGVVDVIFTTASVATGPSLPTNYTLFRYIGSGKTDGSGNWTSFVQDGDYFRWASSVQDVSAVNPGTSAVTRTITVPLGVSVIANVNFVLENTGTASATYGVLSDLGANDEEPNSTYHQNGRVAAAAAAQTQGGSLLQVRTNTSAQIRSRISFSDASCAVYIQTIGWFDRRGRDS